MSGDLHDAVLSMVTHLSPETRARIRRRLALRLDPTAPAHAVRAHELALLAELLRTAPTPPGWSFAHIPRTTYDVNRRSGDSSSASLVERYGSWVTTCRHASMLAHSIPNSLPKHRRHVANASSTPRYSCESVRRALCECANELGRAPSSIAYAAWHPAGERRRRGTTTYPTQGTISRLYSDRGGWVAALEDAQLVAPPAETVRVIASTREVAETIAQYLTEVGIVATRPGRRRLVEARGTLTLVRGELLPLLRANPPGTRIYEPATGALLVAPETHASQA